MFSFELENSLLDAREAKKEHKRIRHKSKKKRVAGRDDSFEF